MKNQWKTSDFDYNLPFELIAQRPLADRSGSRLLYIDRSRWTVSHHQFNGFVEQVRPNDLVVLNDTKVIPARLFGHKQMGGKVECLVERILSKDQFLAHIRASKAPKLGSQIIIADNFKIIIEGRYNDLFECVLHSSGSILDLLYQHGRIPLPPYIQREPDKDDQARYQTIFAERAGAVAAPTAGLHFNEETFDALRKKGAAITYVTLHVGAGTFQPVRADSLADHRMHHEWMGVSKAVCDAIAKCRKNNGRVIAVGTTVIRCLETATKNGECRPYVGETDLFIYPGFQFNCVNALLTNFHLPKSTLLMLVCAFGGYELVMEAYQKAVENRYRFFSYGDAMLIS